VSARSPRVTVVGSVNYDVAVRSDRFPGAGETVAGLGSSISPGGKGANQAAQAALLGADVTFVARVGTDPFADLALGALTARGVDATHVAREPETPTGLAVVWLDTSGENRIVIAPNANARLSPADVDAAEPAIKTSAAVVTQLEIPDVVVVRAAELAALHGVPLVLNVAPPRELPPAVLAATTWLVANESEAEAMSRVAPTGDAGLAAAARAIQALGPSGVVITRGAGGVFLLDGEDTALVPAVPIDEVVDTTGAGDAFVAAFAVALAEGAHPRKAAAFGAAAGAITVSRPGAQESLPTREAVDALLTAAVLEPGSGRR
jgi:ribokinase